jgi:hypothetical protein
MAARSGAVALVASAALAIALAPVTARAEDRARDVNVLRRSADDALQTLLPTVAKVVTAAEGAAPRVVGAYIALDPSVTEATALAACDDDGDPVIMITAAFFELLASLADTAVADVTAPPPATAAVKGSAPLDVYPRLPRVEAYAALLAVETSVAIGTSHVRPVAPAPGTFEAPAAPQAEQMAARLYEAMIDSVVAVELGHLARGDVVCAHPTPTREAADGEWSAAEAEAARQVAMARMRSGSGTRERDIDAEILAARLMREAHQPRDGALVVHRFLAEIEAREPHGEHRPAIAYLATHAGAALAFEAFRAAWHASGEALPQPPPRRTSEAHPRRPHR